MSRSIHQIITSSLALLVVVSMLGGGHIAQASELRESIDSVRAPAQAPDQPLRVLNNAENVELLGHLGGMAQAIEVLGQYAYVGFGPELAVLDVSDPANIQRVGWLVAEGEVRDLSVAGEYAYIAYGGLVSPAGLQIIHISDPAQPIAVATLELTSSGGSPSLTIYGSSVYFAYSHVTPFPVITCGESIDRIDISNSANPVVQDSYYYDCSSGAKSITDIYATDLWLYSLWGIYSRDLKIFDISAPGTMTETVTYDLGQCSGNDLALSGNYAFIAADSCGLEVVDISDPAHPSDVITYTLPGVALGIYIDGETAYITLDSESIFVLDVADPLNMVYLGSYSTVGQTVELFVDGATGYSANGWDGIEIFDTASLTLSGMIAYPQYVNEIAFSEPYAFIAAEDGFWVLDTTDPQMPMTVAHLHTDSPAVSVVIIGSYAYLALPGYAIHTIDITNPLSPVQMGSYSFTGDIRQLLHAHNRLYVAGGISGLHVLDLSDPLNLSEVGAYVPGYSINAIAIDGNRAYLATDSGTLPVLDISNAQSIEEIGSYDYPDDYPGCRSANTVAVKNNIVYHGGSCGGPTPLAGIHGFIRLVDVSDPENPTEMGTLPDISLPTWVSVEGTRAYVKSDSDGLVIYNISDPASPYKIGSYTPPKGLFGSLDTPFGVTPEGSFVFLYGNSTYILRYPGYPNHVFLPLMSNYQ